MFLGNELQFVEVIGISEKVHREDRLRARTENRFYLVEVEVQRVDVDVDEDELEAVLLQRIVRCGPGHCRNDDLVAGVEINIRI